MRKMWFVMIVLIYVLNVVDGVHGVDNISIINDINTPNNSRLKRQDDDRWIWGMADLTLPPPTITTTTTQPPLRSEEIVEENPCNRKPTEMPNFKRPGRRISQQKCYEYIWNIKFRESETNRIEECEAWIRAQNNIYAAIGGRIAKLGEFPHMGAIGWKAVVGTWVFKCGGSLISSKYLLTAAHCTRALDTDTTIADPVPKIVRFGDSNIDNSVDPPLDSNINRIIVHPEYKSPRKYNDIALMEMAELHEFTTNYHPACLWGDVQNLPSGDSPTATGWGVLKADSYDTTSELQVVKLDFIDSRTCDDLLQKYRNRLWDDIQDTQICAGILTGGVDACKGDSGGPLQVKIPLPPSPYGVMHHVVGVTSFGFGCALANTPGVYTRVAPFLDWIESIVWPE